NLQELCETVERTASIAAYLDNQEIADDVIHGLAKNELVDSVTIVSNSGFFANSGKEISPKNKSLLVQLPLKNPFNDAESVGVLQIMPNQNLIERRARSKAFERIFLLTAYTLLITMFVMVCIQWIFVRALKKVASDLHTVNPGEEQCLQPPRGHHNNEIGSLVQDINSLLDLVRSKFNAERSLRLNVENLERRFRMIYELAGVGIFILDEQRNIVMANPAFKELVNYDDWSPGSGSNRDCLSKLFVDDNIARQMTQKTITEHISISDDLRLQSRKQTNHWVHCIFSPLRDDDTDRKSAPIYVQGILNDISERKKLEHALQFQAEHDSLTGLLNRRSLEHILTEMLNESEKNLSSVAICIVDLDDFKLVNDTYGHEAGDKVLIEISQRMRRSVRQGDIVARLGGDEFLCALTGKSCHIAVNLVASNFLDKLTKPVKIDDNTTISVGVSLGIAISNKDSTRDQLLEMADKAMYQVKKQGKNDFLIFSDKETTNLK
ncbi:MAG: diguanylate cyclase, partial [Pseudomonadota bacterium]|nr:diguanylate cyclase [Pseudomonadota bacterium]